MSVSKRFSVFVCAISACGWSQIITSSIVGNVTDAFGGVVPVVLQSCEHSRGAVLICCESAKATATFIQMAPLRTSSDHLCGWVVSAIFALLSIETSKNFSESEASQPTTPPSGDGPVLCARTE
jgi:hypothetical protein